MSTIPRTITEYLNGRGISDGMILRAGLGWNGNEIVIPVNGYFNKYRRSPFSDDGPKYRYDRGSAAELYGVNPNRSTEGLPKYLVEGEFDCLCLQDALGDSAVVKTSTGGCKTFSPEWAPALGGCTVCYDYDQAGIEGAYRVHSLVPGSSICWLPRLGMDVTDYITGVGRLPEGRFSYLVPSKDEGPFRTKKQVNERIDEYYGQLDRLFPEERDRMQNRESVLHIAVLRTAVEKRIDDLKRTRDLMGRKPAHGNGGKPDLSEAKKVPVYDFLKLGADKFHPCIWHSEKTASMKYYPEGNRVYCFGCGKGGDVIDVVMQLNQVTMGEALKILSNR